MDGERFDALARALSTARERRGFVRALAGGAFAAALGTFGNSGARAACKAPGAKCKRDDDCCSGGCRRQRGERTGRCKPCRDGQFFCPDPGACFFSDECCTDADCGGLHCCGGVCRECCVNPMCGPGRYVAPAPASGVARLPLPTSPTVQGDVCGTPPGCLGEGETCAPDGPNAECCGGDCVAGTCGFSAEDDPCFFDRDCGFEAGSGLVCRGFVCAA